MKSHGPTSHVIKSSTEKSSLIRQFMTSLLCAHACACASMNAATSAGYTLCRVAFTFSFLFPFPGSLPTEINVSICIFVCSKHTLFDLKLLLRHRCFRKHEVMLGGLSTCQASLINIEMTEKVRTTRQNQTVNIKSFGLVIICTYNKTQTSSVGGLHVKELPDHICKVSSLKRFATLIMLTHM